MNNLGSGQVGIDVVAQVNTKAILNHPKMDPIEAGKQLARLMERELGYDRGHIDNVALRLFIKAYWDRVSTLAHAIHDGE